MYWEPQSLIPPNPAKIGEYIAAGFELGISFAEALTTAIFEFISALAQFMVSTS